VFILSHGTKAATVHEVRNRVNVGSSARPRSARARSPLRSRYVQSRALTPGRLNDPKTVSVSHFPDNSDTSAARVGYFRSIQTLKLLAPWFRIYLRKLPHSHDPCGSGFTREEALSGNTRLMPHRRNGVSSAPKSSKSDVARCPPALRPSGVAPEPTTDQRTRPS